MKHNEHFNLGIETCIKEFNRIKVIDLVKIDSLEKGIDFKNKLIKSFNDLRI